jgi:hypothetical protein
MATYNKFQQFVEDLLSGKHDFTAAGHVFKVYATDATPSASGDAVKADLAEITPANGYPSGGSDVQNTLSETTGTATVAGTDVVWTASGGSFGPLRYVALYNDTQTTPADPLVSWWDYGSELTVGDAETLTVDFGASIFTLA